MRLLFSSHRSAKGDTPFRKGSAYFINYSPNNFKMTTSVKQKSATYIEWTVKTCTNIFSLPVLSSKIDSKCFVFQNRKCNLEFYTDTSSYGDARLFLKRHGTQIPELDVVVFVSWINNSVRCSSGPEKRRIKSGYQEIWRHEAGKLLGASLNFDIIIHAKLLKKDECVQTASYLNADLSVESLPKDFSEMFDSGLNHDAEIRCGEHSVKAHKNILCARSEVLKAMLESDMVEGRTGIVELQDTDISYIQEFVRYLYTGVIPELTFDSAKALYELGDKYLIKSLVVRSSEYMLDNLSPENACLCLALAEVHCDEKLKDSAVDYILEEKVYLQDEHWLPFCNRCPRLANEVYRIIQARSGLEKKPVTSTEKEAPISTMTVLKKSTEVTQSM